MSINPPSTVNTKKKTINVLKLVGIVCCVVLMHYCQINKLSSSELRARLSTLQCVTCYSVLHCAAVLFEVYYSVLQCAAVFCCVLQCVAVCCSVLQRVAASCSVLQCVVQCVAACCSALQRSLRRRGASPLEPETFKLPEINIASSVFVDCFE